MELNLGQRVVVDTLFNTDGSRFKSIEGTVVAKRTIKTYHGKETNYDVETTNGRLHCILRYFITKL